MRWILAGVLALGATGGIAQDSGQLGVELNKLVETEGGCQTYFLFRNGTGAAFDGLELSMAILRTDGVIDRLLTIDAAPVPSDRTTLKLFEIPEMACTEIGEILFHDIPVCTSAAGEQDCFSVLALASRADAELVK